MIREINIIIATNKNLVNLKNLIYQLLNQKGKFSIKILIIVRLASKRLKGKAKLKINNLSLI